VSDAPRLSGKRKFAPGEAFAEILRGWKSNPLFWLFVIAFPVSCVHQFYFVRTAEFLGKSMPRVGLIDSIFGVGGGGLMTIGQIAEIVVLAFMPLVAKKFSRKGLLTTGVLAYIVRFGVFAYVPHAWAVIPALALHGFCFGCFFFVAFMIVDEETTGDVRASAQGLFNLVVVGLGVIVGNYFAGQVSKKAAGDFSIEFSIPMWVAVGCLLALLVAYPRRREDGGAGQGGLK